MRLKEIVDTILWRLESQEKEITNLRWRVEFLECEHEYVPDTVTRSTTFYHPPEGNNMVGNYCQHYTAYILKCSKCGHILKDITEKKYLLAKLECDKNSCAEQYDETMLRLESLEEAE